MIVIALTLFVSLMIDALTIYQSWDAISATLIQYTQEKEFPLVGNILGN